MAQKLKHRVQMGLESTRGTAVTATLELGVRDDGFTPTIVSAGGDILGSQTFPYKTDVVAVGVTASLALRVELNRDNIRDIILLATKRTAGVLPAVTIIDDQHGVGVARYAGCVCNSLALEFSRGGTPGGENILSAVMGFDCMTVENAGGAINAGLSPASAPRFQIRHGTYTINSVSTAVIKALRAAVSNTLGLGPVNGSNVRAYIEDNVETNEISATCRFATTAWRALVEGQTEHAASFVLATGTANETVTATIGKAKMGSRNLGEEDSVVTEQINLMPYHTGAAAPVVWTYGSSIGASVLGL